MYFSVGEEVAYSTTFHLWLLVSCTVIKGLCFMLKVTKWPGNLVGNSVYKSSHMLGYYVKLVMII